MEIRRQAESREIQTVNTDVRHMANIALRSSIRAGYTAETAKGIAGTSKRAARFSKNIAKMVQLSQDERAALSYLTSEQKRQWQSYSHREQKNILEDVKKKIERKIESGGIDADPNLGIMLREELDYLAQGDLLEGIQGHQYVVLPPDDPKSKRAVKKNHGRKHVQEATVFYEADVHKAAKTQKKIKKKQKRQVRKEAARRQKRFAGEIISIMDRDAKKSEQIKSIQQSEQATMEELIKETRSEVNRMAFLPARLAVSNVTAEIKEKVAAVSVKLLRYAAVILIPIIIFLFLIQIMMGLLGGVATEEEQNNPSQMIIEQAVDWAIKIANDNYHGYNNQGNGWGPREYNCIGLVMSAYKEAGHDPGMCNIDEMPNYLLAAGFIDCTQSVDMNTGNGAIKGDVFWMLDSSGKHGHTEMYIGDGKLVGARGDFDGVPGDGSGNEISVIPYSNMNWQRVFRLEVSGGGSGLGEQIVQYAVSFVGVLRYIWGGTSLVTGADCSGFTQAIYAHFGISIPRTAEEQAVAGRAVTGLEQAQAGDLIYYSGHIAIYMGNGQIVHAANSRDGVKISQAAYRPIIAIRRYIPDSVGNFDGSTNEEICWNFFRSQGFSPAATAGILGNFYQESHFDPAVYQIGGGPGRGLAQWESSSGGSGRFDHLLTFANSKGTSWKDLKTQLQFVMYELNSYMNPFFSYVGGLAKYKNSTDASQAAYDWLAAYEYCGTNFSPSAFDLQTRQAHAAWALSYYGS